MQNPPDVPMPCSASSSSPNSISSPIEQSSRTDTIGNSFSLLNDNRQNQTSSLPPNNQARSNSLNGRHKGNLKIGLCHNSSSNSPSFQINNQMLSSAIRSSSRNNLPLTSKKISFPLGKHSATPPRNTTDFSSQCDSSPQSSTNSFEISEVNNNKFFSISKNENSQNPVFIQNENDYPISTDSNPEVFEQKENNIITQINEISKSIEELLKQRKEIQFQHKRWLDDRKKKIFQVRKETNQMQNEGKAISTNMLLFPIITLVGPTDSSIQQS